MPVVIAKRGRPRALSIRTTPLSDDGGPTEVDNIYLFCRPHRRLLHEGGWRVVKTPDGDLEALPP